MKISLVIAAAGALAAFSSPAFAEGNVDVHGGVTRTCVLGYCDGSEATYGVGLGYDHNVSANMFIGVQGTIEGVKIVDGTYANYGAVVRVGTNLGKTKVFALGGYAAQELGGGDGSASGWRAGLGVEQAISGKFFVKAEYRYSQYSKYGISGGQNTGLIGIGTHF